MTGIVFSLGIIKGDGSMKKGTVLFFSQFSQDLRYPSKKRSEEHTSELQSLS